MVTLYGDHQFHCNVSLHIALHTCIKESFSVDIEIEKSTFINIKVLLPALV